MVFFIGISGSCDSDIKIVYMIDFIVVDFWKDDLFVNVYVVVIVIVKRFVVNIVEVMYMW